MQLHIPALAFLLCFSAPIGAETLSTHKAKVQEQTTVYPARGQSAKQVRKQFGEPQHTHAPVGGDTPRQPAITRWDYPGFSVFFDGLTVIDTVIEGQMPPLDHIDELQPPR